MVEVEFSVGAKVTYFDGQGEVYPAKIHHAFINPVTNDVEYKIMYREYSTMSGYMTATVGPDRIRESKRFGEEKANARK